MSAESVGVAKTRMVLGRHSGRHGLAARLKELGYNLSKEDLQHAYDKFVELADKKKEILDDDLRILMGDEIYATDRHYEMQSLHVSVDTGTTSTATISIKVGDRAVQDSAVGDGPVDATFKAIDRALGTKASIESYQVRSVTAGRDAQGEVLVRIRRHGRLFMGRGVSTDIIEASAKAYLQVLNDEWAYTQEAQNKLTTPVDESFAQTV